MTTEAKPLTAHEIAAMKAADMPMFTREEGQRLIATIEQQREQIEKLRKIVKQCREAALYVAASPANSNPRFTANVQDKFFAAHEAATEILAETEPKP